MIFMGSFNLRYSVISKMHARLVDFEIQELAVLAVPFTKDSPVPINKGCYYMRPEMYFVCFHPLPFSC